MFEGIPIFRFKAPDTLFANGSVYPPNEGFCPCLQSGIQNVSTCRFSTCHPAPVMGGQEGGCGDPVSAATFILGSPTGPPTMRAAER